LALPAKKTILLHMGREEIIRTIEIPILRFEEFSKSEDSAILLFNFILDLFRISSSSGLRVKSPLVAFKSSGLILA
jgi:hypothetical protein